MNREDIIRMAREAWLSDKEAQLITEFDEAYISCTYLQDLKKFAALVASAERESCAKACEDKAERYAERAAKPEHERDINRDTARIAQQTCFHLADNIRARG